ncbi:MAG: hypothetical protein ACOX47_05360 [Bacillota bacterium]|jgi:hypothetical protein
MKIFTSFITLKNGRKLSAKEVGLNAFCFEVTKEENETYLKKKKLNKKVS